MRPSLRRVTPSLARAMPRPATSPAGALTGGRTLAHAPVQVLVVLLSCSNRYSDRPCVSTRMLPSGLCATETTGAVIDGVWPALAAAGEEPPHPAATTAREAGPSRERASVR